MRFFGYKIGYRTISIIIFIVAFFFSLNVLSSWNKTTAVVTEKVIVGSGRAIRSALIVTYTDKKGEEHREEVRPATLNFYDKGSKVTYYEQPKGYMDEVFLSDIFIFMAESIILLVLNLPIFKELMMMLILKIGKPK